MDKGRGVDFGQLPAKIMDKGEVGWIWANFRKITDKGGWGRGFLSVSNKIRDKGVGEVGLGQFQNKKKIRGVDVGQLQKNRGK